MLVSSHIDRLARMAARLRCAQFLCLCLLAASACKLDEKPPMAGGLVVAIDTDMSMPKDIDEVRLVVTQGATKLFEHTRQLDENAAALPLEFQVPDASDKAPVLVRALALKDGDVRVERSAITKVPASYLGYLRLILNYLCDGMVDANGESSCGPTMTCIQGTCEPATLATSLPDFYRREGTMQNAATACFDVAKCLSMASEMTPDAADGCSFKSSKLFPTDINVALRLEPGSAGVCTQTACWIVLDSDGDGFRIGNDDRVFLPESICAQRDKGANLRVAMSMQCPSKKQSMPLCREGSNGAVSDPGDPVTVDMSMSPVSDACAGGGQRSCEMCGSQSRMCQSGLWSPFGMCADQGVCTPEQIESCGVNGIRTCGGDCTWGDCENQTCDGPATRSCGNCGTQHRSCNNGMWSEWSLCSDEGVCMPGASQACGSGGTQACMGNCGWGDCTMQVCEGAASEPCGNCGTRSRTCDTNTATWSEWGVCEGEGECRPDSTQPCGRDGEQTCGGNCYWDVACTGQTCEGPSRRACGLCGTQTRTCDMMTGEYSDWSACFGEGECMPDTISACGNGGERVCGGSCRWGSACTGQSCTGPSTERCGNCGTRSRTCDTNTGMWSGWSTCRNEGDCSPGDTRMCGSGGTQSCSNSCRWSDSCPGQMCEGPAEQPCANNECARQTRACNTNTGNFGGWTPAMCTPGCDPGELVVGNCPPNSGRLCNDQCTSTMSPCTCAPGYSDCTPNDDMVSCISLQEDERNCGRCGEVCRDDQRCVGGACTCVLPEISCDMGESCINPSSSNAHCGGCNRPCTGDLTCRAGTCQCPMGEMSCDGTNNCVNVRNDPRHCGACGNECTGGEMCVVGDDGMPRCQCPAGQDTCGGTRCLDLTTDEAHCGGCDSPCERGQVCVGSRCQLQCSEPLVNCSGQCVDRQTNGQHCGMCGNPCMMGMTCQAGQCACPPGTRQCGGPGTACVPLNTSTNCGDCGNACADGAMCMGGECTCTGNQTNCEGDCVNTNNDEMNCGGCGNACPAGVMCNGGECDCPPNQRRCGGPGSACVPLNTAMNCGDCGNTCTGGTMCMGGMCRASCTAPQEPCDGMCVNTQTSNQHCGECGNPCMNGTTCQAGRCDCPDNQMRCGNSCVNTQTDEANCGMCGNPCPAGTMCTGGMCDCPGNQERCGTMCVDTRTDEANCGMCGNPCPAGTMCTGGMCDCPGNQERCGTMCVDTRTDPNHCGDCATDCGERTCSGGMCQCAADEHRCRDGSCEMRSVESCGPGCQPCPPMQNARPVGCSQSDQCQYDCTYVMCGSACCAQGQTCVAGQCTNPQPPAGGTGGTGGGGSGGSSDPIIN